MNKEQKHNLDINYDYYRANFTELNNLYNDEYIIIQNLKVIFNNKNKNFVTKYAEGLDTGTFIILKIQNRKKVYL